MGRDNEDPQRMRQEVREPIPSQPPAYGQGYIPPPPGAVPMYGQPPYGAPAYGGQAYGGQAYGAPGYGGPQQQNAPMYGYPPAQQWGSPPGAYGGQPGTGAGVPMGGAPGVAIPVDDPATGGRGGGKWGAQDWEVDEDKKFSEDMDKSIRMAFIRKVYAILTCQLVATFGLALWFNLDSRAADYLIRNAWILIICAVLMCCTVCGLTCVPKLARTSPTNYIMLGVLSLCMGGILGYSTGAVSTSAFAQAAGITAAVTLAVSLFACQTKWDFTGAGIYAFVALIILMMFGIIAGIVRSKITSLVYASLGAALFSFYIIMDTQKIVGGKHRKYEFSIDDYAFAALALYLDIINLFLYILQILAMTENN